MTNAMPTPPRLEAFFPNRTSLVRSGPSMDATGEDPKRGASDATTGSGRQGGIFPHFLAFLSTCSGLNRTFWWLNHG